MENLLVIQGLILCALGYSIAVIRQQRARIAEKESHIAYLTTTNERLTDKMFIRQGSTPIFEKPEEVKIEQSFPTIAAKKAQWQKEESTNGVPDYIMEAIENAKNIE